MQIYRPILKNKDSKSAQVGIYVSKEGKDIKSPNRSDYVFIPDRPSASIKKRLTMQVETDADPFMFFVFNDVREHKAVYKHGFNYIPEIIAFVTTDSGFPQEPAEAGGAFINVPSTWQSGNISTSSQHIEVFNAYADDQNVYVTAMCYEFQAQVGVWNFAASYTFDVLLLMEEAK